MASFAGAVMRLAFKKKPHEGRLDEENGGGGEVPPPPINHGRTSVMSSWFAGNQPSSVALANDNGRFRIPADDSLTLFRLMLGITSSPHLGFTERSPIGTRPAANVGIYSRVVHAEQQASDSYKVFSIVINACYFLQIVVGAALTAMGAASVNNKAITAFGAINTVMAGFLTFLRGSGLPGRLKYYENEWKKIREFIEQRERDFSRLNCNLDVYEVVETVERMYENTKEEVELSSQDSFGGGRQQDKSKVGGIDVSKLEGIAQKLSGLEGKVKGAVDSAEKKKSELAHSFSHHEKELESDLRSYGKSAASEVDDQRARVEREISQRRLAAEREATDRLAQVEREASQRRAQVEREISQRQAQAEQEIKETGRAIEGGVASGQLTAQRGMQSAVDSRDQAAAASEQAVRDVQTLPERLYDDVRGALAGQMRGAADNVDEKKQ